ncbi:hypothetical protein GCM10010423_11070 [Streptomyces levis]|uniref:FXSXX-COOH protein n=1 Tax=Streptomyces levis TaxID=285566 RepID=A0ABN3NER8_9ACTN
MWIGGYNCSVASAGVDKWESGLTSTAAGSGRVKRGGRLMERSEEVLKSQLPELAGLQLAQIDELPSAGLRASVRKLLERLEDEQEPLYSFNANI